MLAVPPAATPEPEAKSPERTKSRRSLAPPAAAPEPAPAPAPAPAPELTAAVPRRPNWRPQRSALGLSLRRPMQPFRAVLPGYAAAAPLYGSKAGGVGLLESLTQLPGSALHRLASLPPPIALPDAAAAAAAAAVAASPPPAHGTSPRPLAPSPRSSPSPLSSPAPSPRSPSSPPRLGSPHFGARSSRLPTVWQPLQPPSPLPLVSSSRGAPSKAWSMQGPPPPPSLLPTPPQLSQHCQSPNAIHAPLPVLPAPAPRAAASLHPSAPSCPAHPDAHGTRCSWTPGSSASRPLGSPSSPGAARGEGSHATSLNQVRAVSTTASSAVDAVARAVASEMLTPISGSMRLTVREPGGTVGELTVHTNYEPPRSAPRSLALEIPKGFF